MFALNRLFVASFIAVSLLFCMRGYAAEEFTSEEFLKWDEDIRRSYIQTTMITANLIAQDNDVDQSKCIIDWYNADRREREDLIYGLMEKHSQFHPVAVIIAVFEKQCGSFKYR
ncbi:hypothetical protein [Pseudovibrio exalbescens]|uniref:Rap1a immunity protein domain-containing protein n=1 Tax=Pseudovibrio exalbescens TaxID=197461 RepID=A0A1U7JDU4_9HYPH|nr:hypothetical protein [Pseudovibrio exalbescens]OKL42920.1 hypothetical protein A3843_16310 [Pseudovibrio exalbescens]